MWPQCAGVLKNDSPTVDGLCSLLNLLFCYITLTSTISAGVMLYGGDGPGPLLTAAHANGWKMEATDKNNCLSFNHIVCGTY